MNDETATLIEKLRGRFIAFDGPDGAGKSTQRARLAELLQKGGLEVVSCRDPGGTAIGDRIRSVLLDHDLAAMDVCCETLLFMASRAQLVSEIIKPALHAGRTVLCDRFVSATCAYQGAAGFEPGKVIELAKWTIGDCWPHATVLIDVDADEGFSRIGRKPKHAGRNRAKAVKAPSLFEDSQPDAMEARLIDFHRRVRRQFLDVHKIYPTPVLLVDGSGNVEDIHRCIVEALLRVTF